MRLTVSQADLAPALKWVERRLPRNPNYPVMMTMRFEARGGRLTVTGWDGDMVQRADLDADVEEEGVALFPGKLIATLLDTMRACDLTIEVNRGAGTLTAPGLRIDIRPSDASQWPATPEPPEVAGSVDGPAFMQAFGRVKPASIKPLPEKDSKAKPAEEKAKVEPGGLGSLRLVASDGELRLAATDRFRVAEDTVPWEPATELGDAFAVVPVQSVEQVRPFARGRLQLALPVNGSGVAGLAGDGRQVVTKLAIPNSFPKVERALPLRFVASAQLEAGELLDAVRTVSAVNTKLYRPIWLRFDGEQVAVCAADMDTAEVRIDAKLTGDADRFEIPFRGSFLTDGLTQIKGAARVDFSGPKSPAVMRGLDGSTFRYIVLPIGDPGRAAA
jgi:DNA polymerase-3 subunit beta